jgi:hypothetical protein
LDDAEYFAIDGLFCQLVKKVEPVNVLFGNENTALEMNRLRTGGAKTRKKQQQGK